MRSGKKRSNTSKRSPNKGGPPKRKKLQTSSEYAKEVRKCTRSSKKATTLKATPRPSLPSRHKHKTSSEYAKEGSRRTRSSTKADTLKAATTKTLPSRHKHKTSSEYAKEGSRRTRSSTKADTLKKAKTNSSTTISKLSNRDSVVVCDQDRELAKDYDICNSTTESEGTSDDEKSEEEFVLEGTSDDEKSEEEFVLNDESSDANDSSNNIEVEDNEDNVILANNSTDDDEDSEIDNNKKYAKIFSENDVLIPREKNRPPPLRYSYTVHNLNFMKDNVGKKQSNDYYSTPIEERKGFIIEMVETLVVSKRFYKYNEIVQDYIELDEAALNRYVTKRLRNIRSDLTLKSKKYDKSISVTNKGTDFNTADYVSKSSYMAFEKIYPKVKLAKKTRKWNMFSMFHSLYQSFSIYVYNYSHRLEDKEKVHRCTKVKLTFPEYANCVLIIHGRLVHSGAESKEDGPLSFNWSHDVRMFSYLSSFEKHEKKREIYTNFSENNKVVRDTFRLCGRNCGHCKSIDNTMCVNHDHYKEIDVGNYIKSHSKNNRAGAVMSSHVQRAPTKLLGNMKKLGWEVYTGVQFSLDKYQNLNAQLRGCVRGEGSTEWQGIGGTSRCAFKVDYLLSDPSKKKIIDNVPLITTAYNDIHNMVLKKIPCLGKCVVMEGRSLLANMDQVDEQTPHRDFKEIKK
jgi:hypothetical protein